MVVYCEGTLRVAACAPIARNINMAALANAWNNLQIERMNFSFFR
jgi:hypothetical protein